MQDIKQQYKIQEFSVNLCYFRLPISMYLVMIFSQTSLNLEQKRYWIWSWS